MIKTKVRVTIQEEDGQTYFDFEPTVEQLARLWVMWHRSYEG